MIRLLVLDVDGTLTDGGIYLDGNGNEMKRFCVHDGMGMAMLKKSGVQIAIISGRFSPATRARMVELGIDVVENGVGEKLPVLKKMAARFGLKREEIAYAGDDLNDIQCVIWSGMGFAVNNSCDELKKNADHVTEKSGGYGAVRELCEYIMEMNRKRETGESS